MEVTFPRVAGTGCSEGVRCSSAPLRALEMERVSLGL